MQSIWLCVVKLALLCCGIWEVGFAGSATYKVRLSSSWYPAHRFELTSALARHEKNALQKYDAHLKASQVRAIIVPHAGYVYSGDVAAAAYRLIQPDFFKRIIVIGPSHHVAFQGVGLPANQYELYKNVLGHVDLDTVVLDQLSRNALFQYQDHAHEAEHSINLQLPFIQKYCGSRCKLVPLLVGDVTLHQVEQVASILRQYIDDQTLVVISSDFTHYGKRFSYTPFENDITQRIYELDSSIVHTVENFDLHGFDKILQETGATVCGFGAVKILLALVKQKTFGDVESHVVAYDTSASDKQNPDHSVSYLSLVVSHEKKADLPYEYRFTMYEKNVLLRLARLRLERLLQGGAGGNRIVIPGLLTSSLRKHQGAFVTLHVLDKEGNRSLRGCIGSMLDSQPLYKTVHDMTASAALHDSRFNPIVKSELPYLELSISALTPRQAVASYKDIVLGRDGVVLQRDKHSAVYLPKVSVEHGWGMQQMLSSLSKKAGLPKDAWQLPGTQFEVFQSIDFSENIDPIEIMYEGYKK